MANSNNSETDAMAEDQTEITPETPASDPSAPAWYILKQPSGQCAVACGRADAADVETVWGPFPAEADAIARRVGLIRAGKCKPT